MRTFQVLNFIKKIFSSTLRAKLFFLTCISTFPALLFIFVTADHERTSALRRAEQDARYLARLASREHSHQMRGVANLMKWLGEKLKHEKQAWHDDNDLDFLSSILAGHPQLANIGLLSPDGDVLISAHPQLKKQNWSKNPAFELALKSNDVVMGSYLISPIFDKPTLNHAYALRVGGDSKVWAVLFSGLDLDWLSDLADQAVLFDEMEFFIADNEGNILAYSNEQIENTYKHIGMKISEIIELSSKNSGGLVYLKEINQTLYMVANPLEGASELFVVVSFPYLNIINKTSNAFFRTLAILGFITIFTMISVYFAAEIVILRSLRLLTNTVKLFGKGDFSVRASFSQENHEINSLARAFNNMADSLVEHQNMQIEAQEQLRALSNSLQILREEEAVRISRKLHDEVGQLLTSLKIDLIRFGDIYSEILQESVRRKEMNNSIDAFGLKISELINIVRNISSELRPSVLDKLGLASALEWIAGDLEKRTDLIVDVETDEMPMKVDDLINVALFRVAQEAITNIIRHAQATLVEIKLHYIDNTAILIIKDDGVGIDKKALLDHRSLGVIGMRERVTLIHGILKICKCNGKGTLVEVRVPLDKVKSENFNRR